MGVDEDLRDDVDVAVLGGIYETLYVQNIQSVPSTSANPFYVTPCISSDNSYPKSPSSLSVLSFPLDVQA